MFDSCQRAATGPKCADVSEKIVQLFGWRQTYNVAKLQRNIPGRATTKISLDKPQRKLKAQQSLPLKKSPDSWVVVHNLQTQGGGILDHDDRLNDVVDDREQILASFEDGDGSHHHGGGDGASGSSSVGTGSPDIFNDGNHKYVPSYPRTEIEVTGEQMALGASGALHVRRGSEPALNQLPIGPPPPSDNIKRWSAAPLILEPTNTGYCINSDWEDSRNEDDDQGYFRISRDGSKRLSMQFLGDGSGYRWAEAAERAASHSSTSLPRGSKRKEPLGQANNSTSPVPFTQSNNSSELIVIRNEPGPLGIHVVPDYDRLGKEKGLLVQGIEPGGRIDRDGRLAVNDHIIEINGQSVINMPFQRVQELFKLSLTASELRLRVQKGNNSDGIHRPANFPRLPEDKENISMVECEQKQNINTKVATVSPTKKVPAISRNLKSLITANTRKIGRKIELELTKGSHGLGFSITTRDNPAGGNCPIYIKNIIPKEQGAAVEDGRLKIGDRLLEVNGIEMTGKSQGEAVSILRNVPPGSKVRIVVSRQEDVPDNNLARTVVLETDERCEENNVSQVLNRSLDENANAAPAIPPLPQNHIQNQQLRQIEKNSSVAKIISQFQEANEKSEDGQIFPWKHREILTFDIPVHDSEKAGLGISVKGKTSGSQDLGIFIKSVINGGAASRDKRLRTNDQLLNVNGVSLLHQSNSDAMETLRKAMLHTEGPVPGSITLTIARRASSPGPNRNNSRRSSSAELLNSSTGSDIYRPNDSETSRNESSEPSGGSSNTVIYNPRKHSHTESSIIPNNQNFSPMQTWNPVLDRLTNHNKQLRNESYYIATHDTWTTSMLAAGNQSLAKGPPQTVNLNSGETILVEDDYGPRVIPHQNSRTPLSSCSPPQNKSDSQNNVDTTDSNIQNSDKNTESSQTGANNDVTYASQLSLEQPNPATFSRDAFGRQSMSEKRHATLDAKNTDTYQRTKKMREERDKNKHRETNLVRVGSVESVISVNRSSEHPEQADKLGQLGPSLGMKKSSSLESLQTMVQEMQMQEDGDPVYCYRNNVGLKVVRGRGCEESFRAAVIDPNHRSETTAKKHWLLDPPVQERQIDGFSNVRGGPRQSSLNANLDGKHKGGKKKPGILKGIGSMFRFGKHRKMDFNPPEQYKPQGEGVPEKLSPHPSPQQKQSQPEQNHLSQPEIKSEKSVDQRNNNCSERLTEQPPEPLYNRHGFIQGYAEQVQVIPEGTALTTTNRTNVNHGQYDQNHNRGERSQLMRAYEQRQAQRQHYYHQNTENSKTDQAGRQRLDPGPYGEYGKPGSRYGISEPIRFTHYVNYDELQNHISRKETLSDSQINQMRLQVQQQRLKVEEESRKQQQYHSQRQIRQNNQLRPVSNFYEYESVQSILNVHGRADRPAAPPVTHIHQHSDSYQETNSNSLTRHPGVSVRTVANSRSNHPNHFAQNRGPFITQVLIGDHVQHTGSRV
ncbi:partitioning defective 3 homolog isoform X2 [Agrilus planipennis]|uniref:Partitioning defective 3 homolog isoform X2 n=1 Tax=Agrilus planipennis TaxID=224129 RepID=A0A7F5RHJ1_AGRPL|nr:partitioning defective 3 homolog isoform X2 [Agrilus planipennis]